MQIKSKNELKSILRYEKDIYLPTRIKERLLFIFTGNERYLFFKYLKHLRHEEYYSGKGKLYLPLYLFYARKKNKLGNKINIKILPNFVDIGINIHHKGLIINGYVGKDCIFHGNNCIGNNIRDESEPELLPSIKDRVDFGYGSVVIGDVTVERDVRIGAGAVVIKDIPIEGAPAVGVPARIIEKP